MKAAGRCSCCGELTLPYGGEDVCECTPCDCGACCHEAHTDGCIVRGHDLPDDDDEGGESYLVGEYVAWDADAAVPS